jgi:galactose mutarotase-like enzyme
MKASSDFRWGLDLPRLYAKMTLKGKEKIGDAEAHVVEAATAGGYPTRLYFDAATGLLLRRDAVTFEDYREVDGVLFPFTQRGPGATVRLTEVRHNVELDDASFGERKDCFTQ